MSLCRWPIVQYVVLLLISQKESTFKKELYLYSTFQKVTKHFTGEVKETAEKEKIKM